MNSGDHLRNVTRREILAGAAGLGIAASSLAASAAQAQQRPSGSGTFMTAPAMAELIVLASPPTHRDTYYNEVLDHIFDFHVSFAHEILSQGDDVLILSNRDFHDDYANALGEDMVLLAPMLDIWMRDFAVSNPVKPVMFRYSAAGQGHNQGDSDMVQEEFAELLKAAGLSFAGTDLINDGGNYVDDYAGSVVVSAKFLRDNELSQAAARKRLSRLTGAENIAFIETDERGGLEHADGVVSFVDENTLAINSYPEDAAYAERLKSDLRAGLPNVKIHEIITPYDDSGIMDERFGSACGLYTNALATPERVYLPQFGIPEDRVALEQVSAATMRRVVPVPSSKVCRLGGGVRCMSWQLRGDNARRLFRYARSGP